MRSPATARPSPRPLEVQAVLRVREQYPARLLRHLQGERAVGRAQVKGKLSRYLEQRAVMRALREAQRDPVADEGVRAEQQHERRKQPAEQLPAQQRPLMPHAACR
jgi:hypothetical protein